MLMKYKKYFEGKALYIGGTSAQTDRATQCEETLDPTGATIMMDTASLQ